MTSVAVGCSVTERNVSCTSLLIGELKVAAGS